MTDRTVGAVWPLADPKESKLNPQRDVTGVDEPKVDAGDILSAASATFKERQKVYGDNYLRLGASLAALFPNGVTLKTPDDFVRFHLLMLQQTKVSRYCTNWPQGHQDSIHDAIVYAALLEAFDEGNASTIR